MQLGAMAGNLMVYPLKFGERSGLLQAVPIPSQAAFRGRRCRDWMGGAYGPCA